MGGRVSETDATHLITRDNLTFPTKRETKTVYIGPNTLPVQLLYSLRRISNKNSQGKCCLRDLKEIEGG